jgi:hypothetical protein
VRPGVYPKLERLTLIWLFASTTIPEDVVLSDPTTADLYDTTQVDILVLIPGVGL